MASYELNKFDCRDHVFLQDLLQRFEHMKTQCQELQRDLTMRRCLAKRDEVLKLGISVENVQNQLESHYSTLQQKMPLMEKV